MLVGLHFFLGKEIIAVWVDPYYQRLIFIVFELLLLLLLHLLKGPNNCIQY